ncbi:hypothetical protein CYMTET_49015 [Cymbomonas tetramitiformis]|uniref:Magnesium transporter MgtE intracellular domain-containing protein n=1 Tax=Cymbomonas tetramitiformis TaxID=36881 RepID=A0AAE0BR18_9CHLO|nr:hypothetical protein CYMTET_49015 [Cymbomonas tetramitiformis]
MGCGASKDPPVADVLVRPSSAPASDGTEQLTPRLVNVGAPASAGGSSRVASRAQDSATYVRSPLAPRPVPSSSSSSTANSSSQPPPSSAPAQSASTSAPAPRGSASIARTLFGSLTGAGSAGSTGPATQRLTERVELREALLASAEEAHVNEAVVRSNDDANMIQAFLLDEEMQIRELLATSLEDAQLRDALLRSLEKLIAAGESELETLLDEIKQLEAPPMQLELPPGCNVHATPEGSAGQDQWAGLVLLTAASFCLPPDARFCLPPEVDCSLHLPLGAKVQADESGGGEDIAPGELLFVTAAIAEQPLEVPKGATVVMPSSLPAVLELPSGTQIMPTLSTAAAATPRQSEPQALSSQPSCTSSFEKARAALEEAAELGDMWDLGLPTVSTLSKGELLLPPGCQLCTPLREAVEMWLPEGSKVNVHHAGELLGDLEPGDCFRLGQDGQTLLLPPASLVTLPCVYLPDDMALESLATLQDAPQTTAERASLPGFSMEEPLEHPEERLSASFSSPGMDLPEDPEPEDMEALARKLNLPPSFLEVIAFNEDTQVPAGMSTVEDLRTSVDMLRASAQATCSLSDSTLEESTAHLTAASSQRLSLKESAAEEVYAQLEAEKAGKLLVAMELIEAREPLPKEETRALLALLAVPDAADFLSLLDSEQAAGFIGAMQSGQARRVLAQMNTELAGPVLGAMAPQRALKLLKGGDPALALRMMAGVPAEHMARMLLAQSSKEALDTLGEMAGRSAANALSAMPLEVATSMLHALPREVAASRLVAADRVSAADFLKSMDSVPAAEAMALIPADIGDTVLNFMEDAEAARLLEEMLAHAAETVRRRAAALLQLRPPARRGVITALLPAGVDPSVSKDADHVTGREDEGACHEGTEDDTARVHDDEEVCTARVDGVVQGENGGEDGAARGQDGREDGAARGENGGEDGAARGQDWKEDDAARGENYRADGAARGQAGSEDGAARGDNDGEDGAARGEAGSEGIRDLGAPGGTEGAAAGSGTGAPMRSVAGSQGAGWPMGAAPAEGVGHPSYKAGAEGSCGQSGDPVALPSGHGYHAEDAAQAADFGVSGLLHHRAAADKEASRYGEEVGKWSDPAVEGGSPEGNAEEGAAERGAEGRGKDDGGGVQVVNGADVIMDNSASVAGAAARGIAVGRGAAAAGYGADVEDGCVGGAESQEDHGAGASTRGGDGSGPRGGDDTSYGVAGNNSFVDGAKSRGKHGAVAGAGDNAGAGARAAAEAGAGAAARSVGGDAARDGVDAGISVVGGARVQDGAAAGSAGDAGDSIFGPGARDGHSASAGARTRADVLGAASCRVDVRGSSVDDAGSLNASATSAGAGADSRRDDAAGSGVDGSDGLVGDAGSRDEQGARAKSGHDTRHDLQDEAAAAHQRQRARMGEEDACGASAAGAGREAGSGTAGAWQAGCEAGHGRQEAEEALSARANGAGSAGVPSAGSASEAGRWAVQGPEKLQHAGMQGAAEGSAGMGGGSGGAMTSGGRDNEEELPLAEQERLRRIEVQSKLGSEADKSWEEGEDEGAQTRGGAVHIRRVGGAPRGQGGGGREGGAGEGSEGPGAPRRGFVEEGGVGPEVAQTQGELGVAGEARGWECWEQEGASDTEQDALEMQAEWMERQMELDREDGAPDLADGERDDEDDVEGEQSMELGASIHVGAASCHVGAAMWQEQAALWERDDEQQLYHDQGVLGAAEEHQKSRAELRQQAADERKLAEEQAVIDLQRQMEIRAAALKERATVLQQQAVQRAESLKRRVETFIQRVDRRESNLSEEMKTLGLPPESVGEPTAGPAPVPAFETEAVSQKPPLSGHQLAQQRLRERTARQRTTGEESKPKTAWGQSTVKAEELKRAQLEAREMKLQELLSRRNEALQGLRQKRNEMEQVERDDREKALRLRELMLEKMPSTVPTHSALGRRLSPVERLAEFQRIHASLYEDILLTHPDVDPTMLVQLLSTNNRPTKVKRKGVDLEAVAANRPDVVKQHLKRNSPRKANAPLEQTYEQ